jgi:DNA topoisomerase-2
MSKKSSGTATATKKRNVANGTNQTIEERYQVMENQEEHILKRPDMYIGSIETIDTKLWIYNEGAAEHEAKFILKEIPYTAGLYKIYDEVAVNAADRVTEDPTCNLIKVWIDQATGQIKVWNNGENGIDVAMHETQQMYVPSVIFGVLMSGTNYNDETERTTGGKNGLGAKLTNVYSTEFLVEVVDAKRGLIFKQRFADNKTVVEDPVVKKTNLKNSYTCITFTPDFSKFGLDGFAVENYALFKKRVYDLAMTTNCIRTTKVYFNDELITTNTFSKYVDLHFPDGSTFEKVIDDKQDRWQVCAVFDSSNEVEHQNISFVNSICTSSGGSHVKDVVDRVVTSLKAFITKKKKKLDVKPAQIKENLIFFVNSVIVNPSFESQSKESLKTDKKKFGSTFEISDAFLKKLQKTGLIQNIIDKAQALLDAKLGKAGGGRAIRDAKLYPAHKAGTKDGWKCTLILTEGDSAKKFAMDGFAVIGREYYGVYPLRGKVLNSTKASDEKLADSLLKGVLSKIVNFIGLKPGIEYTDTKGLRYGKVMILADQDTDGSHIKGLLMNFIQQMWPTLAKLEGFITSFVTPLLVATKGDKSIEFSDEQTYLNWKAANNNGKGWTSKYYKGLGSWLELETQECFRQFANRVITYYWDEEDMQPREPSTSNGRPLEENEDQDLETEIVDNETDLEENGDQTEPKGIPRYIPPVGVDRCANAFWLAFSKEAANPRKDWMNTFDPQLKFLTQRNRVSYYDFIHVDILEFARYVNVRMIPHLMDGFKPGQRMAYFTADKKGLYFAANNVKSSNKDVKVSTFTGSVIESTAYKHGDKSMQDTIVGMGHTFVGSNNLNLLLPIGNFGSRVQGGKDAAAPRYIFTRLNYLCKALFNEDDIPILQPQDDDGTPIEPVYYAPCIPLCLVNGFNGIGDGYSTDGPCYYVRDLIANIKRYLLGESLKKMTPYYRNFTGTITQDEDLVTYIITGAYEILDDSTIHISDLPIGTWTDNYKEFLNNCLDEQKGIKKTKKKDDEDDDDDEEEEEDEEETKPAKGRAKRNTKGQAKISASQQKFLKNKSKKSATARVAKKSFLVSALKDYVEDNTTTRVSFTITFQPGKLQEMLDKGIVEKELKLRTTIKTTNMHLFDHTGRICKFKNVSAILRTYCNEKMRLLGLRKEYLLGKYQYEIDTITWKIKFLEDVQNDIIIIKDNKGYVSKGKLGEQLQKLGYPTMTKYMDPNDKGTEDDDKEGTYGYLTGLSLFGAKEQLIALKEKLANKQQELDKLNLMSLEEIWTEELDKFEAAFDEWERIDKENYQKALLGIDDDKKPAKKTTKPRAKKSAVVEV